MIRNNLFFPLTLQRHYNQFRVYLLLQIKITLIVS